MKAKAKDIDTLYYPTEIAEEIGLGRVEIGNMRNLGCPFYGKKTTIRWVREHIARVTGAATWSERPADRQHLAASK